MMNSRDIAPPPTLPDGGGGAKPPTTLLAPPASGGEPPHSRRWTRDEFNRLVETRILGRDEPVELIEGDIIEKVYQGQAHRVACDLIQQTLMSVWGSERALTNGAIAFDDYNQPEPDVIILQQPIDDYSGGALPEASMLTLLVEVAVTTQQLDRGAKAALYARSGVPEYWILDLANRTLTSLREPTADSYASETRLTETDMVSPKAAPDAALRVADLLPPLSDDFPEVATQAETDAAS